MSFARINRPLPCTILGIAAPIETRHVLQIGVMIKHVKCIADGYSCVAFVFREWRTVHTVEDLPAFTDKGSARREARMQDALVHGRPRLGPHTQNAGFKVTDAQREWLRAKSSELGKTVSQLIRATMISIGMPE